jgi:hypothetical protein
VTIPRLAALAALAALALLALALGLALEAGAVATLLVRALLLLLLLLLLLQHDGVLGRRHAPRRQHALAARRLEIFPALAQPRRGLRELDEDPLLLCRGRIAAAPAAALQHLRPRPRDCVRPQRQALCTHAEPAQVHAIEWAYRGWREVEGRQLLRGEQPAQPHRAWRKHGLDGRRIELALGREVGEHPLACKR